MGLILMLKKEKFELLFSLLLKKYYNHSQLGWDQGRKGRSGKGLQKGEEKYRVVLTKSLLNSGEEEEARARKKSSVAIAIAVIEQRRTEDITAIFSCHMVENCRKSFFFCSPIGYIAFRIHKCFYPFASQRPGLALALVLAYECAHKTREKKTIA
ncbi:unnamed protein product [Orchesella dallaii]|uniref:Uncharacterized protein n=1 Tax=Orchesella dallaii TaxID=48710 RepID=A0ABP1QQG3_9HEXA